jgi:hypothetical protein
MTTYTITFGKVGDACPVPPLTLLGEMDSDDFQRAVARHAIPHLRPVLAALGRPELADCYFHHNRARTRGCFVWIDIASSEGARFCGVEIDEVSE